MVMACRELPEQYPDGHQAKLDLLEFEVIPIFTRDLATLVRVSNALNLNIAEKVAKENFQSYTEMGRTAWVKAGSPEPHHGGRKPSVAFEVCIILFALFIRICVKSCISSRHAIVLAARRYRMRF